MPSDAAPRGAGVLIAIGGAEDKLGDRTILSHFVRLAGGDRAHIVVLATASSLGDELITARCDLDLTRSFKETIFNFALHRRPEHYRLIVERAGAEPPPE